MKALVWHGKEDVRIEDVPLHPLKPGEVRVNIKAALTCGTDLKVWRRGYHAAMIHLTLGDFPGTLALADTIQAGAPGHLFAYIIRGEAADRQNDTALLNRSYREFLDHFVRVMVTVAGSPWPGF